MLYRDYLKYREGEENNNNNNNDKKENNKEKEKTIRDLDAKKSQKKGCC